MATVSKSSMIIDTTASGTSKITYTTSTVNMFVSPLDGYSILTILSFSGTSPVLLITGSDASVTTYALTSLGAVLYIGSDTIVQFSSGSNPSTLGYSVSSFKKS